MRSGQVIASRYRLEERLGSGSHGEVWRAADLQLHDRPVALKRALHGGDPVAAKRIRREAGILASINHPNVVTVYDTAREGDDWWIVMEYVPGQTLAEIGTTPVEEAARYGAQLADGLEALHAIGILHRDIKPANILITGQGSAKLADFGISRNVHAETTLTGTGSVTGTPGYVAPEVVRGGKFTAAADVFSLGATLFYAVEGSSPFGDDNAHALLWKTVTEDAAEPERAEAMAPILTRMMRKDPKRRPRPDQVRQHLAQVCGAPGIGAGRRTRFWNRARLRARPRFWTAGAVGAAVGILVAGTWIAIDRAANPSDSPSIPGEGATAREIIGEETTADPCALLDPEALDEFGDTRLDTDDGTFNHCALFVTSDDGGETDIGINIWRTSAQPPLGESDMVGRIGVVRSEEDMPEECSTTLVLPDGNHLISLDAERGWGDGPDLCAMVDAAAEGAVAVLNDGPIPRREGQPDDASLISQSACGLLDNEALELFPGIDADHPLVGFGEWECRWDSTTSGNELRVLFQRSAPLNADGGDPVTLAGRQAFIQGDRWSADSCLVSVVHRQGPSVDPDGSTTAELVRLLVSGDDPVDELCDMAVGLAEPLAAALPPALAASSAFNPPARLGCGSRRGRRSRRSARRHRHGPLR